MGLKEYEFHHHLYRTVRHFVWLFSSQVHLRITVNAPGTLVTLQQLGHIRNNQQRNHNLCSLCSTYTCRNKNNMFRFLVLCQVFLFCEQEGIPAGHLQPLGSHRAPEGVIKSIQDVPSPQTFYNDHILTGQPVIFKGAAKLCPGFNLWTDTYLRYFLIIINSLCSYKPCLKNSHLLCTPSSCCNHKFYELYQQHKILIYCNKRFLNIYSLPVVP